MKYQNSRVQHSSLLAQSEACPLDSPFSSLCKTSGYIFLSFSKNGFMHENYRRVATYMTAFQGRWPRLFRKRGLAVIATRGMFQLGGGA
jgi:hypothetical protein